MRKHITSFDTRKHHIYLECFLTDAHGILYSVAEILDTGAPQTEFSDQFLVYAGLLLITIDYSKGVLITEPYGGTIEAY